MLIMTTISGHCTSIFLDCAFLWSLACYFGHAKKNVKLILTRERLPSSTRDLEKLFFSPKTNLYSICLLSAQGQEGFLSSSVFITRSWLLNLQNCSLCPHPGPPSTSIIWRVKTSCLGGSEDRCEEEMCSHTGPALISQLSSQGFAEGQFHNRMIHHVGLTHLSHV